MSSDEGRNSLGCLIFGLSVGLTLLLGVLGFDASLPVAIGLVVVWLLVAAAYRDLGRTGRNWLTFILGSGVFLWVSAEAFEEAASHPYLWNWWKSLGVIVGALALWVLWKACRWLWDSRVPRGVTVLASFEGLLAILCWVYWQFDFRLLWSWHDESARLVSTVNGYMTFDDGVIRSVDQVRAEYNGHQYLRELGHWMVVQDDGTLLRHNDDSVVLVAVLLLVLGGLGLVLSVLFAGAKAIWRAARG